MADHTDPPIAVDSFSLNNQRGQFLPVTLGSHSLQGPVIILAPLSGVTDFPFRCLVRKYGEPSLVVSEMIASPALVRHIRKTVRRSCTLGELAPISVQLAGNDPHVMAEASRIAVDQGATFIDLNLGCPAKKIAINSYAGSALMRDEVLAGRIFSAVVKAAQVPVTVKMRKGWDNENLNAPRLARIAQDSGISMVTIHGRTRCQLFQGKADWSFFQTVCAEISIPVIGNGDIIGPEEALKAFESAPISGIMVGRGCYGRPWLIGQIRHFLTTGEKLPPPSLERQSVIVEEHFEHLLEHYGTENGLLMARKHLGWYSKNLPAAVEFRTTVFRETQPMRIREQIRAFYQNALEKRYEMDS